jgi:hypothetical protein
VRLGLLLPGAASCQPATAAAAGLCAATSHRAPRYAKRRGAALYSFLVRCFLPRPVFFFVFSVFVFSSIWIPGAARGEKKPKKKVPAGDCGLNGSI